MDPEKQKKLIIWTVGTLVAAMLVVIFHPFSIIKAGQRGVVLRFGKVTRIMEEGLNWKTPFVESVKKTDVTIQKEQVRATSASKDLQNVETVIALNFHLQPDKVGEIWRTLGDEYKERIIDPAIQESVKAATANYTAEELITERPKVKDGIKHVLSERLLREYILVDELSIVEFDFSSSFNKAIEEKVTAEQNALAAKNKLEQVKYEAEQRIAQARGEAEAIRIQAQAITQQGGDNYVELKRVEKWNGAYPQYMLGGTVPLLQIK